MPVVTPELIDGHTYSDVLAGFEIQRVFRVTELTEAPERQLIEAVTTTGIPLLNEVYPGTTGILAARRDVVPDGPNAARVTVTYSARPNTTTFNQPPPVANDGQDVKQISAGTRAIKTTRDASGTPMELTPPTTPEDLTSWGSYLTVAEVLVPAGRVVFERVESSPATARMRLLVGTLNEFTEGPYAAKTLLFVDFDAVSDDGGRLWNCTYTFQYDFGGFQHTDAYKGPDGKVALGATAQSFDVLATSDFGVLGLDFSDTQFPI